jgi:hypothetical protein
MSNQQKERKMFKEGKKNKVTVYSSISKTTYENLEPENAKRLATKFFNDNELCYVNDKFFDPNPLTKKQVNDELQKIFQQI